MQYPLQSLTIQFGGRWGKGSSGGIPFLAGYPAKYQLHSCQGHFRLMPKNGTRFEAT